MSVKENKTGVSHIGEENTRVDKVHLPKMLQNQNIRKAILTILLASGLTGVFAQNTNNAQKDTTTKAPVGNVVKNDSVTVHGMKISKEEHDKVYVLFEEGLQAGDYKDAEEMMKDFKDRIKKDRMDAVITQQLAAELAAKKAKRMEIEEDLAATTERVNIKKEDLAWTKQERGKVLQEIAGTKQERGKVGQELKEIKQQLKQKRIEIEKKLGRKLTEKEREKMLSGK